MLLLRCICILPFFQLDVLGTYLLKGRNVVHHGTPIEPFQPYWTVEQNRIEFSDFFSPDDWFPIEINVPDTIMSAWHGFESAWTAASDYFSMNYQE